MPYQFSEHPSYLRAVINDGASADEFASFYRELQARSAERGFDRAMVIVTSQGETPGHEHLGRFQAAGFGGGFRLALICPTWTMYQACSKAERSASASGLHVRTFLQEMEGVSWLSGNA